MNKTMTSISFNITSSPPLLSRQQGIPFCVAILLEMVAIVIGNSIAIGAFSRPRQLRNRSSYLLVNLAVADLLCGGVGIPLRVYTLSLHFDLWTYEGGDTFSIAYESLSSFIEEASHLSLVMISFERMYAIVWPMKHRVLDTKVYFVLIGLAWGFASIAPASNVARYHSWISQSVELIIWLSFLASCLVLIFINYFIIWIKCRVGVTTSRMASARERRLARSLFLVTMVSLVTLLPAPTVILYSHLSPDLPPGGCRDTCYVVYTSTILLYYANSLINPIIYTYNIPQFKEYAVQLICRRSFKERADVINMRDL